MEHMNLHLNEHFPFLGDNGCDPVLTAYLPSFFQSEPQARPSILICPGGGYSHVSPREAEPIAVHFLPEGFNVFVLTYSVSPNRFPTQLREVAAAMELIHANAETWHVDTNRIAILGFSAGGHLAAHYTNSYSCDEVRAVFPESKAVQASILCYPVILAAEGQSHPGSFRNLVGHYPLSADEAAKFSCEQLVTENTPPTFLWHTTADSAVPVVNSLMYAKALAEQGVAFCMHIYPYGHHGLATVDEQTNGNLPAPYRLAADWLPQLKKWLKIIF